MHFNVDFDTAITFICISCDEYNIFKVQCYL